MFVLCFEKYFDVQIISGLANEGSLVFFIHGPTASLSCLLFAAGGGGLGCISLFCSIMGYPRLTLGMSHPSLGPHVSSWKMVFESGFA